MEEPSRNLLVVRTFISHDTPCLQLKGRWLQRAGFTVGMRVEIVVRENCLLVVPLQKRK